MSTFHLRAPFGGPYTLNWNPTRDPLLGSGQVKHSGLAAESAADQVSIYTYRYALKHTFYRYDFAIPVSDFELYETFEDAVSGDPFELTEGACGAFTDYRKVKFADEGFQRTWRYEKGSSLLTGRVVRGTLVLRASS